jgi:hypothetical protein
MKRGSMGRAETLNLRLFRQARPRQRKDSEEYENCSHASEFSTSGSGVSESIEKKHALASSENLAALHPVFRSACNKEIPVGSVQLLKGARQT